MATSTLFIGLNLILLFNGMLLLWEGLNEIKFSREIKKYMKDIQNNINNMIIKDNNIWERR